MELLLTPASRRLPLNTVLLSLAPWNRAARIQPWLRGSLGILLGGLLGYGLPAHADEPAAAAAPAATVSPATAPPAAEASVPDTEPPPVGFAEDGAPLVPFVPFDGLILEKGNRDPIAGASVVVTPWRPLPIEPGAKVKKGALPPGEAIGPAIPLKTDANGRFPATELPPGTYRVTITGNLLIKTESIETLAPGKRTSITYYAPKKGNPFEVTIRADAVRKEVSEQVLSVQELKRIPGTQGDAIKAVQNLPGVARSPFGGGLLVVWGSAPGDTRVYADGVLIPRIFHFGGFRATINTEFVSDLTFKPGAYGADFGRGLGGIIDVGTRAPKSDRIHGSVTLDLIDGSVTLEGPITKKLYAAVGGRVSWISVFLPIFNRSNFQISPFYWDYQVALRYKPTSRDDIDTFIFGSTDNLSAKVVNPDPATNVDLDTKSYFGRARVRWTHRFSSNTSLMVMPSIGGDTVRFGTGDAGIGGNAFKLDVLTLGYNLRSELRHRVTPWFNITGGVDFEGTRSSFDVVAPNTQPGGTSSGDGQQGGGMGGGATNLSFAGTIKEQSVLHILRTAPYAIARLEFFDKRLSISPQLRLDTTYLRNYDGAVSRTLVSPEPRLSVALQVLPRLLTLKAGIGAFSQLAQPQELAQAFGNPQLLAQFGTTYVGGVEVDPTATLNFQAQFFYKDLRSMITSDPTLRFGNGGLGRVIGGDFLLRQKLWKGLFGWVAYTVSKSERKDAPDQPWRLFRYDQTHILTAVASYKLPWWGLEVGLRFRYVTGNPSTPTVGGLRDTTLQNWSAISGEVYSTRLPDFHQLDLRIDKTWVFNRWKLGLYLDIQNLYNRANTETLVYGGRQLGQVSGISGIPFFPNIGLRADF